MAKDRLFIVKDKEGKEFEPADQDALIKWAQQGKIDLDCMVRSTLVPKWDHAIEVPFLKPILKLQLAARVDEQHNTFMTKLKARINLRVRDVIATNGLVRTDAASYPTADLWLRIAAALTDLVILTLWATLLYLIFAWLFGNKVLGKENVFYCGFMTFWITTILYYVLNISLRTQTPGQKFWGIFLIRNNGDAFWAGRAFFYTILLIPFGLFTPLFIYGSSSGRSAQEIITKTRMVKIIFDKDMRKRK